MFVSDILFCLVLDLRPLCYESLRISFIDNDEFVIFETAVFLFAQEAEGTVGTEGVVWYFNRSEEACGIPGWKMVLHNKL